MTDEPESPDTLQEPPESGDPVCGERLAQARREQQISVLEIAKELHIDEAKVRALETNDFKLLGAPVFAKGHLRKYAELVNVSEDDVLTDYYKMTHTLELPPVVVKRARVRREVSPGPWIAGIIVILAAAAAYWWFVARPVSTLPRSPAPSNMTSPANDEDPEPEESVDGGPALGIPIPEAPPVTEDVPVVPETDAVPASAPVSDGQIRIALTYSGDCWTEITDANGERLFFDMGRAGRSIALDGMPPLVALFGNVENVSVRVNGTDYPIRPNTPGSRTARLTIVEP